MGSSNDKIKKEGSKQDIAQSSASTMESEIDLSPMNIDDYDIKGSSQGEILKSIVSNYALMNKRLQESKASINNEQRRTKKIQTVLPQSPELFKRKTIQRLTILN